MTNSADFVIIADAKFSIQTDGDIDKTFDFFVSAIGGH